MSEHESGSRLDAAIDRAVRRMMDAEPPPGLRRRVLARLEPPAAAIAWWPRLGVAAATMAAIALAVVYMNPGPQRPPPAEPPGVLAEGPIPVMPPPDAVPGAETPPAPSPEAPGPATKPERAPRVERLPDPPRVDDVFGTRPDGRVAAATVDAPALAPAVEPEPLAEIEPLQVPALSATVATEAKGATEAKRADDAQDPPPAQADKPAVSPALAATNVRVELTLTEDGEGAAAPKTVSMLVTNRELGRIRSGVSGASLNVDARPMILDDGRVRVMLTIEYAPGNLSPMSQSMTTVLTSGKPLVVSQSADPKSTRRVQAELTATIVK
jgi:hypothetical protein